MKNSWGWKDPRNTFTLNLFNINLSNYKENLFNQILNLINSKLANFNFYANYYDPLFNYKT